MEYSYLENIWIKCILFQTSYLNIHWAHVALESYTKFSPYAQDVFCVLMSWSSDSELMRASCCRNHILISWKKQKLICTWKEGWWMVTICSWRQTSLLSPTHKRLDSSSFKVNISQNWDNNNTKKVTTTSSWMSYFPLYIWRRVLQNLGLVGATSAIRYADRLKQYCLERSPYTVTYILYELFSFYERPFMA